MTHRASDLPQYVPIWPARRFPHNYLPGPEALVWLVAESPRFSLIFDDREGAAMAFEIADALWPETANCMPCADLGGLTPEEHVAEMLLEMVNAGKCRWDGALFLAVRPEGERPFHLVRWPADYEYQHPVEGP